MIRFSPLFRIRGIYYSLFSKAIPFHLNEDVAPFFIVGSGRCGTTLLRRILNATEDIYIPPENWALSKVIFKFRRLRMQMNWDTLVDLVAAVHCQDTQGWFDSHPNSFVNEMRNCPKSIRSLNRLIDHLYLEHAKLMGKSNIRWGDKTPLNINYMELILQVFPNTKFIHMIRDGVDVVYSWSQHSLYENDIIKPAQRWQSAIKSANRFKKLHPDKILEVRYENLVSDPSQTVKRICSYLNIPFNSETLKVKANNIPNDLNKQNHYKNVLTPITDEHIGKGRRKLKPKDKRILKQKINNKLIKIGYESL